MHEYMSCETSLGNKSKIIFLILHDRYVKTKTVCAGHQTEEITLKSEYRLKAMVILLLRSLFQANARVYGNGKMGFGTGRLEP